MSSGFVTETELAEARKKRQEEWEKVRQPDEPLERPEEPYDGRSLYDRLKEQRDKKDLEFEESHKLKNLIRGLDDDEINFLDIVDEAKIAAERNLQKQDDSELSDFRQRVASLQEQSIDKKINIEKIVPKPKTTNASTRPSQKSILAGIVRKRTANDATDSGNDKSTVDGPASKVSKTANGNETINSEQSSSPNNSNSNSNTNCQTETVENVNSSNSKIDLSAHNKGALKCIGILPGIGKYQDSSDSEKSTDTDDEYDFSEFDWVGRKMKKSHDDSCTD